MMCIQVTKEYQDSLGVHDEWVLRHRVDLHSALRATAARVVDGRKIRIQLGARVASVVSRMHPSHLLRAREH
jgi:salicylate hydroxylase